MRDVRACGGHAASSRPNKSVGSLQMLIQTNASEHRAPQARRGIPLQYCVAAKHQASSSSGSYNNSTSYMSLGLNTTGGSTSLQSQMTANSPPPSTAHFGRRSMQENLTGDYFAAKSEVVAVKTLPTSFPSDKFQSGSRAATLTSEYEERYGTYGSAYLFQSSPPPTHSKNSKSMDQNALPSSGSKAFTYKNSAATSSSQTFATNQLSLYHKQHITQSQHNDDNYSAPPSHQKVKSWYVSSDAARGAGTQLVRYSMATLKDEETTNEATYLKDQQSSSRDQRKFSKVGGDQQWVKAPYSDEQKNTSMSACMIAGIEEPTILLQSFVEEESSCMEGIVEQLANKHNYADDNEQSQFDLESFMRKQAVDYSKVIETTSVEAFGDVRGEDDRDDNTLMYIESLKRRLAAVEDENRLLRGQLLKIDEMNGLRALDFDNQLVQGRLRAKEELDRRITEIKAAHGERVSQLQKDLKDAIAAATNSDESAAVKDSQKLVECLADMISSFFPPESSSLSSQHFPTKLSVKQIWKWLKTMLGEYMNLKRVEASRHDEEKFIQIIKTTVASNEPQEIIQKIKQNIHENARLKSENQQLTRANSHIQSLLLAATRDAHLIIAGGAPQQQQLLSPTMPHSEETRTSSIIAFADSSCMTC